MFFFKLSLFRLLVLLISSLFVNSSSENSDKTIYHGADDTSYALSVGKYYRKKSEIMEFAKLFAMLNRIPVSGLKSFLEKEYENMKTVYMELLRKKALIDGYDKSIWQRTEVLEKVSEKMKEYSAQLQEYKINQTIAREFFHIQLAYEKLEAKFGTFGVNISDTKLKHLIDMQNKKFTEYDDKLLVSEVVLDEKKFDNMEKESIMNISSLLIRELGWNVFTLAFSKSLNAGKEGMLGYMPRKKLPKNIQQEIQNANLTINDKALFFSKEDRGYVLYYVMNKILPDNALVLRNKAFNSAVKKVFYSLLWNYDSGAIYSGV